MSRIITVIFTISFLFSGCSFIYARLTYKFEVSSTDSRVYYEPGAEDLALWIAQNLSKLIYQVEKTEYLKFKNDPQLLRVYILKSPERYSKFSNTSRNVRGSATLDEICLSSKIRENVDRLPKVLLHELSHVHFRQYIGTWQYVTNIPGWFHEGMAVHTSGGGGTLNIGVKEAIESIKAGKHFYPSMSGSIFGHKYANDYNLHPHMYYRQAGLFISFLLKTNPIAFKKSYIDLTKGGIFKQVWQKNYGISLTELWKKFINNYRA